MTRSWTGGLSLLVLLLACGCRVEKTSGAGATDPDASGDVQTRAAAYLDTDRPQRAAELLRSEDATRLDHATRGLAARAEAGSGDWPRVLSLLDGAAGLDTLGGGRGLYLLARAHDAAGNRDAALAGYDAFLSRPDTSGGLDLVRAAARLRRALAGLEPGALAAMTEISAGGRDVLVAEALARTDRAAEVEALASRYTTGLLGQRAWAARIAAARHAGDLAAARALAARARAAADTDAARAAFALASGQLAADSTAARGYFRDAIAAAPGSPAARTATARLRLGAPAPADLLAVARSDRALGLNAEAAASLERWLGTGAGTPAEQADVRVEAADALFDAQRYDAALALLAPIAERTDARELRAGTLSRMGRAADAAALYLDLARTDPAPNLYFAADALHQGGDAAGALPLYARVEREHAGTPWAGVAAMRRAGQAFVAGDFAGAARLWDGYRAQNPGGAHDLRARYWAGRALAEAGDAAAARAHFEGVLRQERESYYALLASEALGAPFWPLPMSASPPADPAAAARVAAALRGVDVLREAGFPEAAEAELDSATARVGPADRYDLAEALVARGDGQRAIRIGLTLGGTSARRMRILYPFPFRRMVTSEARAHGVDPFVAAALMRQESQFSARATSHVGARGLMQLMPATARTLAAEEGLGALDPDDLYLPETSVRLGMRYVGQQVEAYSGALPAVFGAYNAGPHQVDAWRTFPEWGRDALFTERIPFRETRDYVKTLTLNRALYAGLYGTP